MSTSTQATLLKKLNEAVAAANAAEKTAQTAQVELVSRSKTVGLLLLEAKKLHPAVKDFEAFLKKVDGLKLSRAYDLMKLAGGRATDEQLRKETRDRVKKHREKKKSLPRHAPGGVRIFRSRHETGLKCIGMPSDVQFAMWLLDNLADFIFNALYEHLIGCCAPPSDRRVIMRSFVEACCDRITDRMLELVERSKSARTSNGRELVVVKDAAIKAFMKEHDIRLRTCGMSSSSNINSAAQAAGRAAGDRATFGRPVTGAAGALRIGSEAS
jgi:hypothetical protein